MVKCVVYLLTVADVRFVLKLIYLYLKKKLLLDRTPTIISTTEHTSI